MAGVSAIAAIAAAGGETPRVDCQSRADRRRCCLVRLTLGRFMESTDDSYVGGEVTTKLPNK